MISLIINLCIAILPAAIILIICFYRLASFRHISLKHKLVLFALGMLISLPLYLIEKFATEASIFEMDNWSNLLVYSFLIIALCEELFKYLIGFFYPFKQKYFSNTLQLIIAISLIGLGFATLENILYAILFDTQTMITRSFTAVPLHLSVSIIMGYFLGFAKMDKSKRSFSLAIALLIPIIIHGFYDLFIIQEVNDTFTGYSLIFLGISIGLSVKYFIKALKKSDPNSMYNQRAENINFDPSRSKYINDQL